MTQMSSRRMSRSAVALREASIALQGTEGPLTTLEGAELRKKLRERKTELLDLQSDLEWRDQELDKLRSQLNQTQQQCNTKSIFVRALLPLKASFDAWKRAAVDDRLERESHYVFSKAETLAYQCVDHLSQRITRSNAGGLRLLERWMNVWKVEIQSCRVQRQLKQEEQANMKQRHQLEQLRSQNEQSEQELVRQGMQAQSLASAVQQAASRSGAISKVVFGPLISREDLAYKRAEASVRLNVLRSELEDLQRNIEEYWCRAQPYLVASRKGIESKNVDVDSMIQALARVVLPLATSGNQTAAESLRDLRHATGADLTDLHSGRASPQRRPALLPGNYCLDTSTDDRGTVYRPALRNPPLKMKAASSSVDLSRLRAALAILKASERIDLAIASRSK